MKTLHKPPMHIAEIIKHFFVLVGDALWDKVNALNIALGFGTVYAQVLILIGVSAISTEVAWWVQFSLGVLVSLSLIAFNVVKTYLLWRKKDEEE